MVELVLIKKSFNSENVEHPSISMVKFGRVYFSRLKFLFSLKTIKI